MTDRFKSGATRRRTIDDIRSNVAKLEARAIQLYGGSEPRVLRNLDAVCETSRRLRKETSKYAAGSDNQASVEIFLAGMGFNMQEQQRLLHHISNTRSRMVDVEPIASTPDMEAQLPRDLDSYLALKRNEAMQRAVDDVHRGIVDHERVETENLIQQVWEKRTRDLATFFGMQVLTETSHDRKNLNSSSAGVVLNSTYNENFIPNPTVTAKAAEYTRIIARTPQNTWLSQTIDYVAQDPSTPPDVVQMWLIVEKMLLPITELQDMASAAGQQGLSDSVAARSTPDTPERSFLRPRTEANSFAGADLGRSYNTTPEGRTTREVLKLVATSRAVLEKQYLHRIIGTTCKVAPHQYDEYCDLHPEKMKDIIISYCERPHGTVHNDREPYKKTAPGWAETYVACRAGRYDVAALLAPTREVKDALRDVAKVSFLERNSDTKYNHLVALYSKETHHQREDPHRTAVFLLLLAGHVGHTHDPVHDVEKVLEHVASFEDDVLWLRLSLIRHVEARSPVLQSLSHLQSQLLSDRQSLLKKFNGKMAKVVTFLLHALLPSTAIRLLVSDDSTFLDGVQLAILYSSLRFLDHEDSRASAAESPLDFNGVLQRYGNYLLSMKPTGQPGGSPTAHLFHFYQRLQKIPVFVEVCQKPSHCARLFGRMDGGARDGELSAEPTSELLFAMFSIAERAMQQGNIRTVVHVLLVLSQLATHLKDTTKSRDALLRLFQVINPALLSQITAQPAEIGTQQGGSRTNAQNRELFELVDAIRLHLSNTRADIGTMPEHETFLYLCGICTFQQFVASGDADRAVLAFFSLAFIPSTMQDVEAKARAFNSAVTDEVVTATPGPLLTVMKLLKGMNDRLPIGEEKRRLQQYMLVLKAWQAKWRHPIGVEVSRHMAKYDDYTSALK
jgi:hypothetical protein